MFDWIKLILLVLGLIDKYLDGARAKGLIKQGQDEEIARATAAVFQKTKFANDLRERNAKLSDEGIDRALLDLEPE